MIRYLALMIWKQGRTRTKSTWTSSNGGGEIGAKGTRTSHWPILVNLLGARQVYQGIRTDPFHFSNHLLQLQYDTYFVGLSIGYLAHGVME